MKRSIKIVLPIKSLFLAFLLIGSNFAQSQVERKIMVEHFTNTRCSICASKNPGLVTNLKNNPKVQHISYHPSSPYSSCVLNKHDVMANDDRTKYYSIYGGTPRLVLQGKALSTSTNFSSGTLFSSAEGKMSAISVRVENIKQGNDSLTAKISVKTEATHSLSNMHLYVVAVEDTVFYNAPNGEKTHYDVFRKVLIDQDITLASNVGDSVVFFARSANHMDWQAGRMYVAAMVQSNDTKEMEQSNNSKSQSKPVLSVSNEIATEFVQVFPNPASESIKLSSTIPGQKQFRVLDISGKLIQAGSFTNVRNIDVAAYKNGMYFIEIESDKGLFSKKVQVLH